MKYFLFLLLLAYNGFGQHIERIDGSIKGLAEIRSELYLLSIKNKIGNLGVIIINKDEPVGDLYYDHNNRSAGDMQLPFDNWRTLKWSVTANLLHEMKRIDLVQPFSKLYNNSLSAASPVSELFSVQMLLDHECVPDERVRTIMGLLNNGNTATDELVKKMQDRMSTELMKEQDMISDLKPDTDLSLSKYAVWISTLMKYSKEDPKYARMFTPRIPILTDRKYFSTQELKTSLYQDIKLSVASGIIVFQTLFGKAFLFESRKAGMQNYTVCYPQKGIGMIVVSEDPEIRYMIPEILKITIGDAYSPCEWLGFKRTERSR